jgi:hypothetical protein
MENLLISIVGQERSSKSKLALHQSFFRPAHPGSENLLPERALLSRLALVMSRIE